MKYLVVCSVDCNDGDTVEVVTTIEEDGIEEIRGLAERIKSIDKSFCFEDGRLPKYLQGILTDRQEELLHDLIRVTWDLSQGFYTLETMTVYKIESYPERLV